MSRIDESRPFIPLNIAVLTVSDTRTPEEDRSGNTLSDRIEKAGHHLADRKIVKDDISAIQEIASAWIADQGVDVIISTGGTGFTGRDVTPEAMEPLFEKRMDVFSEVFHRISYDKIGTSTIQSRATGGVAGATYIFRPARVSRCLQGCLGRNFEVATRLPSHALQLRGNHAKRLDEHLKRGKLQEA